METLAWFDLAPDYGVLELHEAVTSPGPALELHLAWGSGVTVAWWADADGEYLGPAPVGKA